MEPTSFTNIGINLAQRPRTLVISEKSDAPLFPIILMLLAITFYHMAQRSVST